MQADIINKATGQSADVALDAISLDAPSVVRLAISRDTVAALVRDGNDLIVRLTDGQEVRIVNFYNAPDGVSSDLVLEESDQTLWLAEAPGNGSVRFRSLIDIDELLTSAAAPAEGGSALIPALLAGVAGIGGLAAASGGGGDEGSDVNSGSGGGGAGGGGVGAVDTTAPAAPVVTVASNGQRVTGTGEAGATVIVRDAAGNVIGQATVGGDGTYSVTLSPPLTNGETISATQRDPAGNVSPARTADAPDLTAPAAPGATVAANGQAVTGTGEAGATIIVRDASGNVLGQATVSSDGTYSVTLNPPVTNGERLTATQTDRAGNISQPQAAIAPDLTAPAAPSAAIAGDGTSLTGTGEAGATVIVRDASGSEIARGIVGSDGRFTIPFSPPLSNGGTVTVLQQDSAGNASPAIDVAAPDITAPASPVAVISADGAQVTGTGEAGAVVTVRGPGGAVIGTTIVAGDGSFTVTLAPPLTNGEAITATLTDAATNSSAPTSLIAPDLMAPDTLAAAIATDGASLTGTGEAGATIIVRDAGGAEIERGTVAADGSFTIALAPPRVDGTTISLVQQDAAGNVSSPLTLATPDLTAPDAPTANVAADGASVIGLGEAGAIVIVSDPDGNVIGRTLVGADGSYIATLAPRQIDGEALSVRQEDERGNASPATTAIAPDLTAPDAPTADISADGATVNGTGEPGARIEIRDVGGSLIGQALVAANGQYSATLTPAQIEGEQLSVDQFDPANNRSPSITLISPDLTAPEPPVATIDLTGTTVSGTGEPGATISVRAPNDTVLSTAQVSVSGSYTVILSPPQIDSQTLSVVQTDDQGNASGATSVIAPDLTAPDAPVATVSGDGTQVTGTGEAGTVVRIFDPTGQLIGTGNVQPDGSFVVALAPAQVNGEALAVRLVDAAGNASAPASPVAPDLVSGDSPAAPVATISADGSVVSGTGESGAALTVRGPDGTVIGTGTVQPDGSFSITLDVPQRDGELLSVVQLRLGGAGSTPAFVTAPDLTAPDAPAATLLPNGDVVVGTGEPGATVTVSAAGGTPLGTGIVNAAGNFAVALTPAQANGETLSVVQADAAGNVSPSTPLTALDTTPPAAPMLAIGPDGTVATGTGEPGATVTILDPEGAVIGTAVVDAGGSYTATLTPPQIDAELLSATQRDAENNISPVVTAVAPDLTAPGAPIVAVTPNGARLVGTGEAGAAVTITDGDGTVVATGIVAPNGSISIVLVPAITTGEPLLVTQTDPAGNVSPNATAVTPDLTAPDAPTATIAPDGANLFGTGEPGATVRVLDSNGVLIGTAIVGTDGRYAITFATPPGEGELLSVDQRDAAGNRSPAINVTVSDLTAPDAPVAVVTNDGLAVTGTGEPGATVTVTDSGGLVIGSGTVTAVGDFTIALAPPLLNGEIVGVALTDAAGNTSPATSVIAPDLTAPAAPFATIAIDGASVSGTGEPGATVSVRVGGAEIGRASVDPDGGFTVTLSPALIDGQAITVVQADGAGNVSPETPLTAPDYNGPPAPTATVAPDGTVVTGIGSAGATITVFDPDRNVLGSTVVAPDGSYSVMLNPPQIEGDVLSVRQVDGAGNASPPVSAASPDLTAPDAPMATVAPDGLSVTGSGEPGAIVTVRAPDGTPLGSGTVLANGSYGVTLSAPQVAGQVLTVTQTDPAGNISGAANALAPDLTAPTAPTATVAPDGLTISGTGEAGAVVTIRNPAGDIVGSVTVLANGSFSTTLTPPQANGEVLTVLQTDGAGNTSPGVTVTAPDITPPAAPTDLAIDADGTTLTGRGEVGASVEVTDADGDIIGMGTIGADGRFSIELVPSQVAGGTLAVLLSDAAGNESPAGNIAAPFDIEAFDNNASAALDLEPVLTDVDLGSANYAVLLSLGAIDLQAQILAVPNVVFTVEPGHSLDANFTYGALADIGVASDYRVVVQRFDGGQWVSLTGAPGGTLLSLGLLNGDLNAAADLGPGQYRAFVAFEGLAGLGLLGGLEVAGIDSDFTQIGDIVPGSATGNLITDPGPGGEVDVASPTTIVESVTFAGTITPIPLGGATIRGDYGTLTINPDGSYAYLPGESAAAIGRSDTFTYTLLDPSDGERETALLAIAISSGDVTGLPIAVADIAAVSVSYEYLVVETGPTPQFSFDTPAAVVLPVQGSQSGSFTVAANDISDVTINAVRGGVLAVLPSYTITVQDGGGAVVATLTGVSVLGPLGPGLSLTVPDLAAGNYTYTVSSTNALGTGYTTNVSISQSITSLDEFDFQDATTATGNILANDVEGSMFAILRIETPTGFETISSTLQVDGDFGTLFIDADGGYRYVVDPDLAYGAQARVESFAYEIVQPGGATATATLDIAINAQTPLMSGPFAALYGGGPEELMLFEAQGDLETVLAAYLGERTEGADSIAQAGDALSDGPPMLVEDPFGYIQPSPLEDNRPQLDPILI